MDKFKLIFKENGKEFHYEIEDESYEAAKGRAQRLAAAYDWELVGVWYV